MTVNSVPRRSPVAAQRHTAVLVGAMVLLVLGVVLSLNLGFASDDPSTAPVPDWQFYSAWAIAALGIIGTAWAMVGFGRRGSTWAWIMLGVLAIPVLAFAATSLAWL